MKSKRIKICAFTVACVLFASTKAFAADVNVNDFSELKSAIESSTASISVVDNITSTGSITVPTGASITLTGEDIGTGGTPLYPIISAKTDPNFVGFYVVKGSTLSIENLTFKGFESSNTKDPLGSVINNAGYIKSIDATFTNNKAVKGGAIQNNVGKIDEIKGIFENNGSTKGAAGTGGGGAIRNGSESNSASAPKVSSIGKISADFKNNTANTDGGAICNFSYSEISEIAGGTYSGNVANGTTAQSSGGGAIANNVDSTIGAISDVTFSANTTKGNGGAISNYYKSADTRTSEITSITSTTFSKNIAEIRGGAIFNTGTIGSITDSTFEYNESHYSGGSVYQGGGAIANAGTIGTIEADFTGNQAGSQGGAIMLFTFADDSIIKKHAAIDSVSGNFEGNFANDLGGAISIRSATGTYSAIINSLSGTFTNNSSKAKGGALHVCNKANNPALAKIELITDGSEFTGNSTGQAGGAISLDYGTVTIGTAKGAGVKFENNCVTGEYSNSKTPFSGGAIYNENGVINIINSEFKGNHVIHVSAKGEADGAGGAIYTNADLNIIADGGNSTFSGNYIAADREIDTPKTYEAIYVGNYNKPSGSSTPAITLTAQNKGTITFDDSINGGIGYNLVLTGDASGRIELNNKVLNSQSVSMDSITLSLAKATDEDSTKNESLATADVNATSGTIDLINDGTIVETYINSLTGSANLKLDIDTANKEIDTIHLAAAPTDSSTLTITELNGLDKTLTAEQIDSEYKILYRNNATDDINLALSPDYAPTTYGVEDFLVDVDNEYKIYTNSFLGTIELGLNGTNDTLQISATETKNTFEEIYKFTTPTGKIRSYNFLEAGETVKVAKNLDSLTMGAGEFSINGKVDGTNISTLDINSQTGFKVSPDSILNLSHVKLANTSEIVNNGTVNISDNVVFSNIAKLTGNANSKVNILDGAELNIIHGGTDALEISTNFATVSTGTPTGQINFTGNGTSNSSVKISGADYSYFSGTINLTDNEKVTFEKTAGNKFFNNNATISVKDSTFVYNTNEKTSEISADKISKVSLDNAIFSVVGAGKDNSTITLKSDWINSITNTSSLVFDNADYVLDTDFTNLTGQKITFTNSNIQTGDNIPHTDIETPASTPEKIVYAEQYNFSGGTIVKDDKGHVTSVTGGKGNEFILNNSMLDMSKQDTIDQITKAGDIYVFDKLTTNGDGTTFGLDVNLLLDHDENRLPYGDQIFANAGSGTLNLTKLFITDDNGKLLRDDGGNFVISQYNNKNVYTKGKIQILYGNNNLNIAPLNNLEILTWATNLYKYGIKSAESVKDSGHIDSIEICAIGNSSNDTLRDMNMYTSVHGRTTRGFNFIPTDADGKYENKFNLYRDLDETSEGIFTIVGNVYEGDNLPDYANGVRKSIIGGEFKPNANDQHTMRIINEDIGTRLQRTDDGKFIYYEPDLTKFSDISDFVEFYKDGEKITDKSTVTSKDNFDYAEIDIAAYAPSEQIRSSMFEVVKDTELTIDKVQIQNAKRYTKMTYDGNTIDHYDDNKNLVTEAIILDKIQDGSVIYANNANAKITLTDVDLVTNSVDAGNGGAIANILSNKFVIDNSVIRGNSAKLDGGAIYNKSAGMELKNITAYGNTTAEGKGGAIYNKSAGMELKNITAYGNTTAEGKGGAIYTSADMTISDSIFGLDKDGKTALNQHNSTTPNDIYIDGTVTLTFTTSDNNVSVINSGIAGGNTATFIKDGSGSLDLTGNNEGFEGTLAIAVGTFNYNKTSSDNSFVTGTVQIGNAKLSMNIGDTLSETISNITNYNLETGNLIKTGAGTLNLAGNNSGFTGNLQIQNGTVNFDNADSKKYIAGNTILSDNTVLNYTTTVDDTLKKLSGTGTLNKLGTEKLAFKVDDNSNFSGDINIKAGTLNYTAASSVKNVDIDNNFKIGFDAAATDAAVILNGCTYTITNEIKNSTNNYTKFNNSTLKLNEISKLSGKYVLTNSTIDLQNNSAADSINFNSLSLNNAGLKVDMLFDENEELKSDTISATSATGQVILSEIKFLSKDNGKMLNKTTKVLSDNLTFDTASSIKKLTTSVYQYDVSAENQDVTLKATEATNGESLKVLNQYEGIRQFSTLNSDNYTYTIENSSLGTTASGTFTIEGNPEKETIISGNKKYSMFTVSNETNLTIKDLTLSGAKSSGNGSVINQTNTNSSVVLDTLTIENNSSAGKGGAVYTNGGTLTIFDTDFSNNEDSSGANDIYIAEKGTVDWVSDVVTSISSGIAGSGKFNKKGADQLNLSGNNRNFKGNLNIISGDVLFSQDTVDDTFISGITTLSDNTKLVIDNTESDITIGTVAGSGTITKLGDYAMILSGDNSNFTGDLGIHEGSVIFDTDIATYISGNTDILSGSELVVITNTDDTTLQKISGLGTLTKNGTGTLTMVGDNSGFIGDLSVNQGILAFAAGASIGQLNTLSLADETTLNLQNTQAVRNSDGQWTTNPNPSSLENLRVNTLNLTGNVNLMIDVDLKRELADTISADEVTGTGHFILGQNSLNVVSDALVKNTSIKIAEGAVAEQNVITLSKNARTVMGPIQRYDVTYENGLLGFTRQGGDKPDINSVNPAVMASPVASQVGGYLTQLQTLQDGFYHMDRYSKYSKSMKLSAEKSNTYAINDTPTYTDNTEVPLTSNAMWVKPYTTFEKVNLKGGLGVSNVTYGALYGGDSDLTNLGHGFKGIISAFVGYNGSHQAYNGISMNQQGGTLGLTGTVYKGNFFTGLSVSTGASAGEAYTPYGQDHFAMLTAGIANKTGYNIEINDGKFILQPSLFLGYTFVNTFDYRNAAGIKMASDPLHAIQVVPGVKAIGNLSNGWQPYAEIDMVYNIMGKTNVMANDVRLPQLSVKPYVQYGVGLQKSWGERFTAFFQTMIRNGGRNGIVLTGGFRWLLGKSEKNKPVQPSKKTVIKHL